MLEDASLALCRRGSIYYARLWIASEKKYIWRSLKTSAVNVARNKARRFKYEVEQRTDHGLPPKSLTFSTVIDQYLAMTERKRERGQTSESMLRQTNRISKFWHEFIGSRPVDTIGDKELRAYPEWRREYYSKKDHIPQNAKRFPTDASIQFDMMIGKAILKWAAEKGLRGNLPKPSYSFVVKKRRVRPAFSEPDYAKLIQYLERRRSSMKTGMGLESHIRRDLLFCYVTILANSGIRPGEANNLKLRDVEKFTDRHGSTNYRLHVHGKTGEREVIIRSLSKKHIFESFLMRQRATEDDFFFVMPRGNKVITLIDQFNAALKAAGVTHDGRGRKYTIYSLRHFYAVQALRNNIPIFSVAKNMGTSVEMIQKYYASTSTTADFAEVLGGF